MTKSKLVNSVILTFLALNVLGQEQIIPLWTGLAPGSESWTQKEVQYQNGQNQAMVRNVVSPSLTVYRPDSANSTGIAVIVAPGGGFRFLSWQNEGTEVAKWLNDKGITAFVLKYRTMDTGVSPEEFRTSMAALFRTISRISNPKNAGTPEGDIKQDPDMARATIIGKEDGKQAIRIVRSRCEEWGIDPQQIGILGFSAGGMLALGTLLDADLQSRPDFAGLIYTPWSASEVPEDAPPIFIAVAGDDAIASTGSIGMYKAWKAAGAHAELHLYSRGGHGFGMQKTGLPSEKWIERFWDWLEIQ